MTKSEDNSERQFKLINDSIQIISNTELSILNILKFRKIFPETSRFGHPRPLSTLWFLTVKQRK